MELSTTNGHITIDYLFIYQPICFPLVVLQTHSPAGSHSSVFLLSGGRALANVFFCPVVNVIQTLKV